MSDEMADARARVGRVLNEKWTLERLIGIGGMAAVYAARHRNGARAAVKILHPQVAREPSVRDRFLREGYAANRVEHPGAVRVLDDDTVLDGPDKGAAYLVMELLEGESLEERTERPPPITEAEFLSIAASILDVLEAAHARGVVHRDLKPANIFLVRDEDEKIRVKLLDFGLARLTEGSLTTQFGIAVGTPSYMSPEQASGRMDEIDGRTDIFALGASAFRLIARRRIHEMENMALVIAMANEPAPRVRDVAPHVSQSVAEIIDRAVAFRREDRYASAAAMRADVLVALDAMGGAPPSMRGPRASLREIEPLPPSDPVPPRASVRASTVEPSELSSSLLAVVPRKVGCAPFLLLALLVAGGTLYVLREQAMERLGLSDHDAEALADPTEAGEDAQARPIASTSRSSRPTPPPPKRSASPRPTGSPKH